MNFAKNLVLKTRLSFTKSREAKAEQVSLKAAEKIGILIYLNDTSLLNEVENFAQFFIKEGKKVEALSFSFQPSSIRFTFPCKYISMEDIKWNGEIDGETVNNFIKTPFDYLYSINILPILPFDLILRKSKAKCRIGKHFENSDLDLMLQIPQDMGLAFLMEQMKIYSNKINTEQAG